MLWLLYHIDMSQCLYCQSTDHQSKAGCTEAGSQRFHCGPCQKRYTPNPKERGYAPDLREQAVRLYLESMSFRAIARVLGVNHQTIINWINAHIATLPDDPPVPEEAEVIEMDELHTFIQEKKRSLCDDHGRPKNQLRIAISCRPASN